MAQNEFNVTFLEGLSAETSESEQIAQDAGLVMGLDYGKWAGMCPFMHDKPELRLAWMNGFSQGRVKTSKRRRGYDLPAP